MELTDIETVQFTYESTIVSDSMGEAHPGEPHEATRTLTRVHTDTGEVGICFGGSQRANDFASEYLVGEDALDRNHLWDELRRLQRLNKAAIPDGHVAAIDCALWDLAGKHYDAPVYRLLGGTHKDVPAYASTMVGDDDPDGLGTPEAYADFAEAKVEEGYPAVKLHTWFPPFSADPDRDLAACRAVRERVGPDIDLMLDSYHFYSRSEALQMGRALHDLDYKWFEEPMDEFSTSSYEWLTRELDIPVIGPETAEGKMQTRAEWIKRDVSDISRVGVWDVGGITPALKTVNTCESFGVRCEVHGGGAVNLHLLAAMTIPGEYYERGLLHPKYDYDAAEPWLETPTDELNDDGTVSVPEGPGLGYDVDWDFIERNRVE
jgi:L-alanine-DL-glutamate epimerase-like enolase superfamily enzyme